jgi:pimeloyl-ACP methyl ester carboxylesterase
MKLQSDVKGAGPVLVLVGGGLTGWQSWQPHQARLAASRQVARVQPLNVQFGLEARRLPSDYSVKMESGALAATVTELGAGRAVDVVAWSHGALVTLDFALDHPELVRTLTLIEPPAFWVLGATGRLDPEIRREVDDLRAFYLTLRDDVNEEQLAEFCARVGLVPPGKSARDLPPWPGWIAHRLSLRQGDAAWRHEDAAARLRAFERPVLLVKGTGSTRFLHGIVDGLAATLPHARTLELPGGHAPQIVAMDRFLEELAAFQAPQPERLGAS